MLFGAGCRKVLVLSPRVPFGRIAALQALSSLFYQTKCVSAEHLPCALQGEAAERASLPEVARCKSRGHGKVPGSAAHVSS